MEVARTAPEWARDGVVYEVFPRVFSPGGNLAGQDRVSTYLRRAAGEETLVAVNLSSRPWTGRIEIPAGHAFTELTPDVPPPLLPGAKTSQRSLRPAAWPNLSLDAWGFRIFRRPTN